MDTWGNKIQIKPEEFRVKGKKQKNKLILSTNDDSIVPEKIFYYDELENLIQYKTFMEMLFCQINTKVISLDYTLEELQEIFKEYKKNTIKNKLKDLYNILQLFDDHSDNSILEEKIKWLEEKLVESNDTKNK